MLEGTDELSWRTVHEFMKDLDSGFWDRPAPPGTVTGIGCFEGIPVILKVYVMLLEVFFFFFLGPGHGGFCLLPSVLGSVGRTRESFEYEQLV